MKFPARRLFSFQAKVLAPVLAFLVLLPMVTIWVTNRHVTAQAAAEGRRTLATADAVFRNSLDILGRGLATRFRGFVNEPRFKAVAQLGDANTLNRFLRDSLQELGGEIKFLTYSIHPGSLFAGALVDPRADFVSFLAPTTRLTATAFEGEVITGVILIGGQHYNVVCVPVLSNDRLSILGVLTIGLNFGNTSLQELKSLTRADIAIFSGNHVSATTMLHELPGEVRGNDGQVNKTGTDRVFPLVVGGEHFFALSGDYASAPGRPGFRYLLMSSYEARLQELRGMRYVLGSVSLIGILISSVCVWWLIRRITQPLRVLRDSAEAVGRGDFSRRVERFSNDECGELAGAFNHMTSNLQASRTELERTVDILRSTDARLRESEEQLRLTIESARDHMICTLDAGGRIQRWNAAAERLLGYSASEAQNLAYARFFTLEDGEAGVPQRLLTVANATGCDVFEGWRVRHDGTRFWADVTLSRLPDGAGFVEISRDNTLRKDAEEAMRTARDTAEAANRAKTEFIANMSHELRTPMNAIIGMASLLHDEKLPDHTSECVETIRTSADALLEIIDDVLDLSKIEAGRLELNEQPFDLCGCVEDVVDLFSGRCRERNIDLSVHLAGDLPGIVVGDSLRLRQVLGNLIGNAIKFTECGGVTVDVSRDKTSPGGEKLLFSVQDTGIGIPADRMDRLFKMFSQVDASTTRRFGGMGLGLAISRRLTELMGGGIGVESEPGRGSRFFFTIQARGESAGAAPEFSGLEKSSILMVGPETITTAGVHRQLATWGARVRRVGSPSEVDAGFDLILVAHDVVVSHAKPPAENSRPILRLVRKPGDRGKNSGDGFVDVTMPVKPRALHAAVRKVLDMTQRPADMPPADRALGVDFSAKHPLRVLLVEDNPVNARVARLLLERLGYASDWAVDGRKGVDAFAEKNYDLVLMDLQMPVMDGLEASRTLWRVLSPDRMPYIMALTANARKEDRDACAAAGMQDFISKPVQLEKLAAGLERAYRWVLARDADIHTAQKNR